MGNNITLNQPFIWQFNLSLKTVPFWSDWGLAPLEDETTHHCEQRFFWSSNEVITLQGLSEAELWLSAYDFETHDDLYLVLDDNANIKFRKKKLHVKPLLSVKNNMFMYGKKEKYHLFKQRDEIASLLGTHSLSFLETKAEVKASLRAQYLTFDVYKETLTLALTSIASISIELSKIKVDDHIFYSLVVESYDAKRVDKAVQALGISKAPQDYVQFLKGIL